jgi:hypothetical protein
MSYKTPIQWIHIYSNVELYGHYVELLKRLAARYGRSVPEIENAIYYLLHPDLAAEGKTRRACYRKFASLEAIEPYLAVTARRELHGAPKSKMAQATVSLDQKLTEGGLSLLDLIPAGQYDTTLDEQLDWLYGCLKGIGQTRGDKLSPLARRLLETWGESICQENLAQELGVNQSTVSRQLKMISQRLGGRPR